MHHSASIHSFVFLFFYQGFSLLEPLLEPLFALSCCLSSVLPADFAENIARPIAAADVRVTAGWKGWYIYVKTVK
jgi:hypothetical protein